MPNTPVRAAAEGLPKINRRKALALTPVVLGAALTGGPAAATAAVSSNLAKLIQEYRTTLAAYDAACDRELTLLNHPDRPPHPAWRFPSSEFGLSHKRFYNADVAAQYFDEQIGRHKASPNGSASYIAKLEAWREEAVSSLQHQHEAQVAFGIWKADEESGKAYDLAVAAYYAVLDCTCTSLADARAKAALFLSADMSFGGEMEHEESARLLRSLLPPESAS
jgi:hypothetical protein